MVIKYIFNLLGTPLILGFVIWALVRGIQNAYRAFKARAWFGVLWSALWFVAFVATWGYIEYSQNMIPKFCQAVTWLWGCIAG